MNKRRIILLTGGARSGKSHYALKLAADYSTKHFIATAEAFDEGMAKRIKLHQMERTNDFKTHEVPLFLGEKVKELASPGTVIVIDCLTVWITNLMHHKKMALDETLVQKCDEILDFIATIQNAEGCIVLVANEVGLGIIPESEMGRSFRDIAGRLNQWLGDLADEVILMVCGQPLFVKGRET
ncbi:MAG: bifunctional adenosylcobinamide kinase/adenosylcobinamide-phosphate guanylyltransferase [Verrucomicrobiota bacterium]